MFRSLQRQRECGQLTPRVIHIPSAKPRLSTHTHQGGSRRPSPERNRATVPPNINQAHERNAGALKLPELIDAVIEENGGNERRTGTRYRFECPFPRAAAAACSPEHNARHVPQATARRTAVALTLAPPFLDPQVRPLPDPGVDSGPKDGSLPTRANPKVS